MAFRLGVAIIRLTGWLIAIIITAMTDPDFHARVIDAVGGKAVLARHLGLEPAVLSKWHVRGIPSKYWHRIMEIRGNTLTDLTIDKLDQTKPSTAASSAEAVA